MSDSPSSAAKPAEIVVAGLPAEIDVANAATVEAELRAACAPGRTVLADMSLTTYCDSSGIRAILLACGYAQEIGGSLCAAVPSEVVRRALELVGATTIFDVHPTMDAARVACGKQATRRRDEP